MRKRSTAFIVFIALLFNLSFCLKSTFAETYTIPELDSESAVLMDARTGQVLFAKNMDKKQFPASITKIMTGMLALEKGKLNDIMTMSHEAVFSIVRGSSHIALDTGEKLFLQEALYALSIESANDAANGIAEYISGDSETFAELMNKRARELGAKNTHFVNANGLDDPNHYTTAYDMAVIMRQAIKTPQFKEIFSANYYEMAATNLQTETRYFHSTNFMLNGKYKYEGIVASKHGWTTNAHNTLVTAASRGGRDLIVAVMNSQGTHGTCEDTVKLFDYGFNDFKEVTVLSTDAGENIPVFKNNVVEGNVMVEPAEPVSRLLHKSLSDDAFDVSYEIINNSSDESIETKVTFNLKQENDYMYEDLGSMVIVSAGVAPIANINNTAWAGIKNFFKIVKTLFLVLIGLLAVVLILRQINLYRIKRKRMSAGSYRINYLERNISNKDKNKYSNSKYNRRDYDR